MKPKSLEELAAQIEAENELFNALSPKLKRVVVAQDALLRIKLELIKPTQGSFIDNVFRLKNQGGDLKTVLNTCNIQCESCAKGSIFLTYISRTNNFDTIQLNYSSSSANVIESNEHSKLLELFDLRQLDLIETAFEGESYLEAISTEEVKKAIAWKKRQKVGTTGLLQRILTNIVKNKGTFIV